MFDEGAVKEPVEQSTKGEITVQNSDRNRNYFYIVLSIISLIVIVAFFTIKFNRTIADTTTPSIQIDSNSADQNINNVQATTLPAMLAVNEPTLDPTSVPTSEPTPEPTPVPFKLGEVVASGKFDLTTISAVVTTNLKSKYTDVKTEDQFVVVQLKITNRDDRARDASTSMFKLLDGDGNKYDAYERNFGVSGDELLFYETINPGLSRTRLVAFETPKGIKNLTLLEDSGVALASTGSVSVSLGQ